VDATYQRIARCLGASDQEASLFASCYLRADLRGLFTAGAAVVPYIVELIRQDLMRFGTPFELLSNTPATALVDGHCGVGSVVAAKAMDLAIDKASDVGVGIVTVRNSGDFGLASNHPLQAVARGQIGIAMRNGTPRVAPWGGRDPFFGTNPLSIAVPAGAEPPIVIDMASGSFSVGRTVFAARDGIRMPTAHLVDSDGNYTDDPARIVVDARDRESPLRGALVSFGHKGYCWQLIVEVLAGVLSGAGTSNENNFAPTGAHRWGEGTFVMAIDVNAFMPASEFKAAVDQLTRALREVRPAQGFDRVRVPGELAVANETDRRERGVPLRTEDWDAVLDVARRLEAV
jgi:L-2-hydroxycarboxylate dehydrogenase (NAD+)